MQKVAFRQLFWHGTGSNNLRKILKEGLIPEAPNKMYSTEFDSPGHRSIKTYGGIYLAPKISSAYMYAKHAGFKKSGNPLIIGVDLETRTTIQSEDRLVSRTNLDEDKFFSLLAEVTYVEHTHMLSELIPSLEHNYYDLLDNDLEALVEEINEAPLTEYVERFKKKLLSLFPRLTRRFELRRRQIDLYLEDLIRVYIFHLVESELSTQKSNYAEIPLELVDTWYKLKTILNRLTEFIPEVIQNKSEDDRSDSYNIRTHFPINFSGRNKIVFILEEVNNFTFKLLYHKRSLSELENILSKDPVFSSQGYLILDKNEKELAFSSGAVIKLSKNANKQIYHLDSLSDSLDEHGIGAFSDAKDHKFFSYWDDWVNSLDDQTESYDESDGYMDNNGYFKNSISYKVANKSALEYLETVKDDFIGRNWKPRKFFQRLYLRHIQTKISKFIYGLKDVDLNTVKRKQDINEKIKKAVLMVRRAEKKYETDQAECINLLVQAFCIGRTVLEEFKSQKINGWLKE